MVIALEDPNRSNTDSGSLPSRTHNLNDEGPDFSLRPVPAVNRSPLLAVSVSCVPIITVSRLHGPVDLVLYIICLVGCLGYIRWRGYTQTKSTVVLLFSSPELQFKSSNSVDRMRIKDKVGEYTRNKGARRSRSIKEFEISTWNWFIREVISRDIVWTRRWSEEKRKVIA
jgi:hypothetical protein